MSYKERQEKLRQEYLEAERGKLGITDTDEIDPDDIMAHVVNWDYQNKLANFVQNRSEIAAALNCTSIWIEDGEVIYNEIPSYGTIRR